MNNYVLSYQPYGNGYTEARLLNHVQVNRYIVQYYQPFAGTYLLKSDAVAGVLSDSFRGFFEQAPFVLISFLHWQSNGQLPPEIWQWINEGVVPPPPPPSPPPLQGLLGSTAAEARAALDFSSRRPPKP